MQAVILQAEHARATKKGVVLVDPVTQSERETLVDVVATDDDAIDDLLHRAAATLSNRARSGRDAAIVGFGADAKHRVFDTLPAFAKATGRLEVAVAAVVDEVVVDLLRPGDSSLSWHAASTPEDVVGLVNEGFAVRAGMALQTDEFVEAGHLAVLCRAAESRVSFVEIGAPVGDDDMNKSLYAFRDRVLVGRDAASVLTTLVGSAFSKRSIWLGCIDADRQDALVTLEIMEKARYLEEPPRVEQQDGPLEQGQRQGEAWLERRGFQTTEDDENGWYLVNVSPRPTLSYRLRVRINEEETRVGSAAEGVQIAHACVLRTHCALAVVDDAVMLWPEQGAAIRVNGEEVEEEISLDSGDIVVLGSTAQFVVAQGGESCEVDGGYQYDAPDNVPSTFKKRYATAVALVAEANASADELSKEVRFELKVIEEPLELGVVARSEHYDVDDTWSEAKLATRICGMRRARRGAQVSGDDDPFYDPPDHRLVGVAFLYLDALTYLMELREHIPIIDFQGRRAGELLVSIEPRLTDDDDEGLLTNEEAHLKHHLGETMTLQIRVVSATRVPSHKCASTFVRTKWFLSTHTLDTPRSPRASINPRFDAVFTITQIITADFLDYLASSSLELQLWGARNPRCDTLP